MKNVRHAAPTSQTPEETSLIPPPKMTRHPGPGYPRTEKSLQDSVWSDVDESKQDLHEVRQKLDDMLHDAEHFWGASDLWDVSTKRARRQLGDGITRQFVEALRLLRLTESRLEEIREKTRGFRAPIHVYVPYEDAAE
jgi:hypothetical protein